MRITTTSCVRCILFQGTNEEMKFNTQYIAHIHTHKHRNVIKIKKEIKKKVHKMKGSSTETENQLAYTYITSKISKLHLLLIYHKQ